MMNFKKVITFKIISILIAVLFLVNSTAYGITLPQKTCLRKPLDFGNNLSGDAIERWKNANENIAMSGYLELLQSELVKNETVFSLILEKLSEEEETDRIKELKTRIKSGGSYSDKLNTINTAEIHPIILNLFRKEGVKTELYERFKEIISRKSFDKNMIWKDSETFALAYILYRPYFSFHQDASPVSNVGLKLTRDVLVQIIRDLYNPFYERQGFFVCDFFAGDKVMLLPEDEMKKIGYNPGEEEQYIFGIEANVLPSQWQKVSTKGSIGIMRGDIFELNKNIPASTVDAVTMFNPPNFKDPGNVDRTIKVAKDILKPGGWVYIGVHFAKTNRYDYKEYAKRFLEAVKNQGFDKIEEIPYPDDFQGSRWGRPASLIRAQKPDLDNRFDKALLKESPLGKYLILAVLRRMNHGGSVYNMLDRLGGITLLMQIAGECSRDLREKIMATYGRLKDTQKDLRQLIVEAEKEKKVEAISDEVIQDWESRLKKQFEAFQKVQEEFAGLKDEISKEELNKESLEIMSEMFEDAAKEWVSILKQGVDLINHKVVKEEINLKDIIRQAIEPYKKFVEFIDDNSIPNIYADPMMVLQIITNILVNAKKLSIDKVTIKVKPSKNDVMMEITDNGPGFHEDMTNANPEQDGSYKVIFGYGITYIVDGTGLGLAENNLYTRLHKGSLHAFSRPSGSERGASFIIMLPAVLSVGTTVIKPANDPQVSL